MILPYCVYILFSQKDLFLYTGYTSNLDQRIEQHNEGKNKSTAYRRPLICIFAEYFLFKEDAIRREGYFKTSMGKKAIRLMLTSSLIRMGYRAGSMKEITIHHDVFE